MIQTIVEVCENDAAVVAARARWVTQEGYSELDDIAVRSEADIARAYKRKDGSDKEPRVALKAIAAEGSKVRVLIFKGNL